MLTFLTAGESHGKEVVVIISGIPAGVPFTTEDVSRELSRRRGGPGRGGRVRIEKDEAGIVSGVRGGLTTGAPVSIVIGNTEWDKWKEIMSAETGKGGELRLPRPGHADLAGAVKFGLTDFRNIAERTSGRETAARVAAGSVIRKTLAGVGVNVFSHVVEIGGVKADVARKDAERIARDAEHSPLRCAQKSAEAGMARAIENAGRKGDTVGGVFEVIATGVIPGAGSCAEWQERLDGRIAMAVMSIQGVKGVEMGLGFGYAGKRGSQVHDEILLRGGRLVRGSNNAGGIEGGMANGQNIIVRAVMKPIPTLGKPLRSVNLKTLKPARAEKVRSDVCAVPSCAVVGESMVATVILSAYLDKFGGDTLHDLARSVSAYRLKTMKMFRMGQP